MPASTEQSPSETIQRDSEFPLHLSALGLTSAEEYVRWCAERGFSTRLKKHWRDRSRERYAASNELVSYRLKLAKEQCRKPRQTLETLFAGKLSEQDLTQPSLRVIHALLKSEESDAVRQAFQKLLLATQIRTGLISILPALSQLGERKGNTYLEAMLALARVHDRWLRDPQDWQPPSHNVRRQFSSLSVHLVGKYSVPLFLDSAWFRGTEPVAAQQQEWYLALACGESPRRLSFPIPLTKRMTRFFLHAPQELLIESALRWGQVLGLGGDIRLARAILGSRLGQNFEHNEFWTTVMHSFVEHPMLDSRQIGPIIDFIHQQKFESEPGNPEFSMEGRTPISLLNQVREWHADLRKGTARPELKWLSSGISNWEWQEHVVAEGAPLKWTITELLNRQELFEEGKVMRHCVSSYDSSCALGRSSIWSLSLERDGKRRRVLTIEVSIRRKAVCQIRGKANRLPIPQELELIRRWAAQEQLLIDSHIGP